MAIKENPIHTSHWIFNGGEAVSFQVEFIAEFVCENCQTVENTETIGAMLKSKGYSFEDNGKGIYQEFKIDKISMARYAEITNSDVVFGLVAGIVSDDVGTPLSFDENGEVVAQEKTVSASFGVDTTFSYIKIKLAEIDKDASIYCGAFIAFDKNITYVMGENEGEKAIKYDFKV